ncbi:putative endonuclease V [Leptomonas pyrrhocoris]|uniref:Putative endonuclease V n=1 Tax=Leptomonas pyrrhocoris TaxID=157538 RepID=A0A0M9G198_LEPPY|nr:putative endonuclease V [Leptomonas pyrrhocoris]KPA80193.1 putative endonuclease V [Leptomonas pyrrhocoris]|eukprot:XP_015658632.1 putative endonuclease V [Leptomonas pyrrhocoris]
MDPIRHETPDNADTSVSDARLVEKKATWTQVQLRLGRCTEVPGSELYGCADTPLRQAGAFDENYVHKRFSLAGLEAALMGSQETTTAAAVEDPSGNDSSSSSPYWTALRRQLRWDVAQQIRYGEQLQQQQQQRIKEEGEDKEHFAVQSPSSLSSSSVLPALTCIGGVDISFIPNTNDGIACLVILRYPSLELVKTYMHRCTLREPYISTFLAFREIEPIRELFEKVRDELTAMHTMPQLLVVDGNGVHHPRRCGLATHLGVTLDIPTIGCSKKVLQMDGISREAVEAAFLKDAVVDASMSPLPTSTPPCVLPLVGTSSPAQLYGYAVHSHLNSVKKSIFVSPGHCVGFAVATALIVTMLRHRIPEPVRAADLGSRAFIRDSLASAVAADATVERTEF